MAAALRTPLLMAAMLGLAACGGDQQAPAAGASGPARFDKYCSIPGFAPAPRQTIIIVDEHEIAPNPAPGQVSPQNLKWTRWLGKLADADGAAREAMFAPRERLTLMVAPKDGSEPRLVFTGCVPFFSQQETKNISQKQGSMSAAAGAFFGSGAVQTAVKDALKFRNTLGAAAALAGAPETLSKKTLGGTDFASSGLVESLRHGGLVNLADGVPRIVLVSDLSRFGAPWQDVPTARAEGFKLATASPLDLKRADVYVLGTASSLSADRFKSFAEAYLLGSAGVLKGWGQEDVPFADPPPRTIRVFSGIVRYGPESVPMRLRLGSTDDGKVANAWMTVRRDLETSTPFSGEVVSDGQGGEIVRSDGHGFGQLWSLNPDPAPEWTDKMAFGGLRNIEIQIHADGSATGKVSDPAVTQIVGNPTPYIAFKLTREPGVVF